MTFAEGLETRAAAARYCTVPRDQPNPFHPPATFLCATARAINAGFWVMRQETWLWPALSEISREVFYFVANEALLAAKAWREAHGGSAIPEANLARVISDAYWALSYEPERRYTWDSQHANHRLTWADCARRVLDVAVSYRKARAA